MDGGVGRGEDWRGGRERIRGEGKEEMRGRGGRTGGGRGGGKGKREEMGDRGNRMVRDKGRGRGRERSREGKRPEEGRGKVGGKCEPEQFRQSVCLTALSPLPGPIVDSIITSQYPGSHGKIWNVPFFPSPSRPLFY